MKKSTYLFVCLAIALCLVLACSIRGPSPNAPQSVSEPLTDPAGHEDAFCLAGCPTGAPVTDRRVLHHVLELENNPKTKFADWVAYRITAETLGKGCKRIWAKDPDLTEDVTLEPQAYQGAHEALASDRGHQAPLASLCGSPYWYEADYLSNITPQKSVLNEGPWEHLEAGERRLIKDRVTDSVYSITGPLYEREMPKLPNYEGEHKVPSGYWKVVSIRQGSGIVVAAFVMDQNAGRDEDFCGDSASLESLQKRTHLQFFPALTKENVFSSNQASELRRALGC